MKINKSLFLMIGLLAAIVSQGLFGFSKTAEADRDVEQTV